PVRSHPDRATACWIWRRSPPPVTTLGTAMRPWRSTSHSPGGEVTARRGKTGPGDGPEGAVRTPHQQGPGQQAARHCECGIRPQLTAVASNRVSGPVPGTGPAAEDSVCVGDLGADLCGAGTIPSELRVLAQQIRQPGGAGLPALVRAGQRFSMHEHQRCAYAPQPTQAGGTQQHVEIRSVARPDLLIDHADTPQQVRPAPEEAARGTLGS